MGENMGICWTKNDGRPSVSADNIRATNQDKDSSVTTGRSSEYRHPVDTRRFGHAYMWGTSRIACSTEQKVGRVPLRWLCMSGKSSERQLLAAVMAKNQPVLAKSDVPSVITIAGRGPINRIPARGAKFDGRIQSPVVHITATNSELHILPTLKFRFKVRRVFWRGGCRTDVENSLCLRAKNFSSRTMSVLPSFFWPSK